MENIAIGSLKPDTSFTEDLYIDTTFLLLPRMADLTEDMIKCLTNWGFNQLLCEGTVSLSGSIGIEENGVEEKDETPKEKISENVKKAIADFDTSKVGNSDTARMEMVQNVYDEYMNYIESVFTHYATHKKIDQAELEDTVQQLCIFIKDHRRYILRINPSTDTCKKNFLVIHSMRTTVLAIAIGLQLHLPLSKMIELGVTCILHEIGMLRLPPQLYMSTRKLTPGEKAQISKHTVFGYTIIKDLEFPLTVQLGVLEHHEKENGTGYPRKMTGDKISSNAKIIAVACTYEAISSPRSYKDERSTFDALLEMIQNKDHPFDDAVLKALLYTVSLYPIGTYVYLSNRKVAIVVDSNPENPKYPIVQLLTEKEDDGSLKTLQTEINGVNVLRILTKQEQQDILKFIDQKKESLEIAKKEQESKAPESTGTSVVKPVQAAKPEVASNAKPVQTDKTETAAVTKPAPAPSEPASVTSDPKDNEIEEVDISFFN